MSEREKDNETERKLPPYHGERMRDRIEGGAGGSEDEAPDGYALPVDEHKVLLGRLQRYLLLPVMRGRWSEVTAFMQRWGASLSHCLWCGKWTSRWVELLPVSHHRGMTLAALERLTEPTYAFPLCRVCMDGEYPTGAQLREAAEYHWRPYSKWAKEGLDNDN